VHPKLHVLPIGPKWNWRSTEFMSEDKTENMRIFLSYCLQPNTNFRNKDLKKNLLYFNYTQWTTDNPFYKSHKDCRKNTTRILQEKGFPYNPNLPFEQYIRTLSTYKFSVSPPGAGIDTHRTWESLMVGTIPVMLKTPLDRVFENLPVILVDDFSVVDREFLEKKYIELQNREYDFSILYSMYWDRFINSLRKETQTQA
jgi:hypothetical protein